MSGTPVPKPKCIAAFLGIAVLFAIARLLWSWTVVIVLLLLFVILFLLLLAGGLSLMALTQTGVRAPGQGPSAEPMLRCTPSALASYLLVHCPSFGGPRWRGWPWWALPSLQTAVSLLGPTSSRVHFVREHLQLRDEGLVALDWAVGLGARRRRSSSNSSAPVLLCIPNSFGKVTRNFTELCQLALTHGYHPVIFNRRCHNDCPLSTAKLQPYGDPCDLREAVQYICHRHHASRLFAVAESTGAGLLFSYLGECGSSSYLTAAACISPLLCPQEWFEDGCPWFWEKVLLLYQKFTLSRYVTALGEAISMEKVLRSSSLKELEESLFCQTGTSTSSWESYWERNDPLRDVDEVATPVLCICSQDDPIRGHPVSTLPVGLFETNPHLFLLLTQHGGHCGFWGAGQTGAPWSHEALLEFFKSTVDFFVMEEKHKGLADRKGADPGASHKAAAGTGVCRQEPICTHSIHQIYKWQRSYTR
ncbi:hypothetical protein NDU88_003204 [Pleurodeles waltl]|uniref:Protein ABHD15 n=1 Tax=Pleurodeles waltl TaxID=8319 RepID=A0AAV7UBW1_PLEWA|nr:hypothetical protein NDU88_003204 [Pleurodeles waltl]